MKSSTLVKHLSCSCDVVNAEPFMPYVSKAFAEVVGIRVCGCGLIFSDEAKWIDHFFDCLHTCYDSYFIEPDAPQCRKFDDIAHQIVAWRQEQQPEVSDEHNSLAENPTENPSEPSSSAPARKTRKKPIVLNVQCPWCNAELKSNDLIKHLNSLCRINTEENWPHITRLSATLFGIFKVCGCGWISRDSAEWKEHSRMCTSADKAPLFLDQSTDAGDQLEIIALRLFALRTRQQQGVGKATSLVEPPMSRTELRTQQLRECVQYQEKHLWRQLDWDLGDFPWHLYKQDDAKFYEHAELFDENTLLAERVKHILLRALIMNFPDEDPEFIKSCMSISFE